ncbi:MAG: ABC transporter ATP-binding protein [Bacteroidales bacterium]|nr:ABC transporter ATP-binding protein [Bacteroidales bacterium]
MLKQLRYFFEQSKGFRLRLLLSLTLGFLSIVFGLLFIYISKCIVDIATSKLDADLWTYVGILAFMLFMRLALRGINLWVNGRVSQGLVNAMRSRLFDDVLNSPWHGREDRKSGDVMSRIGEDLRVVVECITRDIPDVFLATFQLLAASWFLFSLQPRLLWIVLVIVPVAIVLTKIYYKTMRRLTKQIRREEADIQSHIQESVENRPLLLSLRRTGLMIERLVTRQEHLFGTFSRRLRFSISTRLLISCGFMIGYYTAFVWSAYGIMIGTVTYGMMTALLQLVGQVQSPILNLSALFPAIVKATTAGERLQELENPDPTYNKKEKKERPASSEIMGLQLQDVSYRYPDGDHDVLHSFTYTFAPATSTAIVGPTGSGKSTLVRILLGLLRPTGGTVCLVDPKGNALPLEADEYAIAYVPQGNSLLSGTIRDNLQLGKLDATEEEMRDALALASALFVYDLPRGLDTLCGEKGSGLSEGQAQRIAIARALLQPGSILIMDEASSALDPNTERQILEELQRQELHKTLIWVTHHMVVRDYMQHCVVVDEDI